jgi:hypothetical protein
VERIEIDHWKTNLCGRKVGVESSENLKNLKIHCHEVQKRFALTFALLSAPDAEVDNF